jgi:uncharacterized OsmC-like protein
MTGVSIESARHGDLDLVQRDRLAGISTKCPVRKTLAGDHVSDESARLTR